MKIQKTVKSLVAAAATCTVMATAVVANAAPNGSTLNSWRQAPASRPTYTQPTRPQPVSVPSDHRYDNRDNRDNRNRRDDDRKLPRSIDLPYSPGQSINNNGNGTLSFNATVRAMSGDRLMRVVGDDGCTYNVRILNDSYFAPGTHVYLNGWFSGGLFITNAIGRC